VAAVSILCYQAQFDSHIGEIASCQVTTAERITLAKDLNDMHALAVAQWLAGFLGQFERNPAKVETLGIGCD